MDETPKSSCSGDPAPELKTPAPSITIPCERAPDTFSAPLSWFGGLLPRWHSHKNERTSLERQLAEARKSRIIPDSITKDSSNAQKDDINHCYSGTTSVEDDDWVLFHDAGPREAPPQVTMSFTSRQATPALPDPISEKEPVQRHHQYPTPGPNYLNPPRPSSESLQVPNPVSPNPPAPDVSSGSSLFGEWGKVFDPNSQCSVDVPSPRSHSPKPRSPSEILPLQSAAKAPDTTTPPQSDEPNTPKTPQSTSNEPTSRPEDKQCECRKTCSEEIASWMAKQKEIPINSRLKGQKQRSSLLHHCSTNRLLPREYRFDQPCCDAHIAEVLANCLCNDGPSEYKRTARIEACLIGQSYAEMTERNRPLDLDLFPPELEILPRKNDPKVTTGTRTTKRQDESTQQRRTEGPGKCEQKPAGLAASRQQVLSHLLDKHLDLYDMRPAKPGVAHSRPIKPAKKHSHPEVQAVPSRPAAPSRSPEVNEARHRQQPPPPLQPASYNTKTAPSQYDPPKGAYLSSNFREASYDAEVAAHAIGRAWTVSCTSRQDELLLRLPHGRRDANRPLHMVENIVDNNGIRRGTRPCDIPWRGVTPGNLTDPTRAPWADDVDSHSRIW